MKIYFSGITNCQALRQENVQSVLISYHYAKREIAKLTFSDIFVDSGAFSAWQSKITINIDSYITFLQKHQFKLYANLDVIEDAETTLQNWKYIRQQGLNPIPVFHTNEDFRYLEYYCKMSDYIAIGGMVGKAQKYLVSFLNKCFSVIKQYWPLKVHGFGLGNMRLLLRYPFFSTDSTSWLTVVRFGKLCTPNYRTGKMINYTKQTDNAIMRYKLKTKNHIEQLRMSIKAQLNIERHVTSVWAAREIAWN